jgi:hypothetical protein
VAVAVPAGRPVRATVLVPLTLPQPVTASDATAASRPSRLNLFMYL